tara:strand:+ start:3681 stop:3851 length:171 start_codon:yes stop_codon:yes gene_type:complete
MDRDALENKLADKLISSGEKRGLDELLRVSPHRISAMSDADLTRAVEREIRRAKGK